MHSYPSACSMGPWNQVAMVAEFESKSMHGLPLTNADLAVCCLISQQQILTLSHTGGPSQPPSGRLITLDPFHNGRGRDLSPVGYTYILDMDVRFLLIMFLQATPCMDLRSASLTVLLLYTHCFGSKKSPHVRRRAAKG